MIIPILAALLATLTPQSNFDAPPLSPGMTIRAGTRCAQCDEWGHTPTPVTWHDIHHGTWIIEIHPDKHCWIDHADGNVPWGKYPEYTAWAHTHYGPQCKLTK